MEKLECMNHDMFYERLIQHRQDVFKRKQTASATKEFWKQYDNLDADSKENAIAVLSVMFNTKIPSKYKTDVRKDGLLILRICGFKILYEYESMLNWFIFHGISQSKKTRNIKIYDYNMMYERLAGQKTVEEQLPDFFPCLEKYDIESMYDLQKYMKRNGIDDIRDALKKLGCK